MSQGQSLTRASRLVRLDERWNARIHEATLPSSYCQKDHLPASLGEAEDWYLVGSSKTFIHQKRFRLDSAAMRIAEFIKSHEKVRAFASRLKELDADPSSPTSSYLPVLGVADGDSLGCAPAGSAPPLEISRSPAQSCACLELLPEHRWSQVAVP